MELQQFRLERMAMAAKAQGAELVIASLPANIAYLTDGYRSIGQEVLCRTQSYVAFDVVTNKTTYVMSTAEIPSILEHDSDAQIYCYGAFGFFVQEGNLLGAEVNRRRELRFNSPEEALSAAILDSKAKTVALDESKVNFEIFNKLCALTPKVEYKAGTPVFMQARMIKHPEEIKKIKASALAAEKCLAYAVLGFKEGMTELNLELRYNEEAGRLGAKPYFFVATAADRAAYADTKNTSLPIKKGDMIRFDFGVLLDGYCSDLSRTAVVGSPDEKTATYYNAVRAGTETAVAAIKPGVSAAKIFNTAVEATQKAGIPHYARHHCGHGIGLEAYDLMSITPDNTEKLKEDMVFCIETPYYELGWGGVQVEDTVWVTAEGARYLDESSRDLIIL